MKDERFEWQTRYEFNAYCKRTLRNELINARKERKRRQKREVIFSDLTPHEEKQLYSVDAHFDDSDDHAFRVGGLVITPQLLDEKRVAIRLYYFSGKTDVEIAKEMNIPRSTVQYRRTSSFKLLKRYLEERADEYSEW